MKEFSPPLVKSHPSARIRQLLGSAELDVPPTEGKARALAALSRTNQRTLTTTNFSGIALGTTVHRLLGAVTLYGTGTSPLRQLARGAMVGATAGVVALAGIVAFRWASAPNSTNDVYGVSNVSPASPAESPLVSPDKEPATTAADASVREQLVRLERDWVEGRADSVVEGVDILSQNHPASQFLPRATLLKIRALVRLNRLAEAEAAATGLRSLPNSQAESSEARRLLKDDSQSATAPRNAAGSRAIDSGL